MSLISCNILLNESPKDFLVIKNNLDKYIGNDIIKSYLNNKYEELISQSGFSISLLDEDSKENEVSKNFWKDLKERYPEKILYLNLWVTW